MATWKNAVPLWTALSYRAVAILWDLPDNFPGWGQMTLQEREGAEENYGRFIQRVLENREVWGLRSSEGWAVCDSLDFTNRRVIPFWSHRAYAERAAIDEWADYTATAIELSHFVDTWLVGMARERVLVGANWDVMNCGLEVEPDDLAEILRATQS